MADHDDPACLGSFAGRLRLGNWPVVVVRCVAIMSGLFPVLRCLSTVGLRLDAVQRCFRALLSCRLTTGSGAVASLHQIGTVPCATVSIPAGPVPVDLRVGTIR